MALYSSNRLSNLGTTKVSANESYVGSAGLGRIMAESAQNDMRIFEAVLAHDFDEVRGLHEGTLLESEIRSMNEGSIKDFFATLKARLLKFWEKIKGVFKTVYAKLTEWIVRNGKAFVNLHRKELMTKDFSKFPGAPYYPAGKLNINNRPWDTNLMDILKVEKLGKSTDDDYYSTDGRFMKSNLSRIIGVEDTSVSTFSKDYHDAAYPSEEKKFKPTHDQITKMMDNVYSGKAPIKKLKELETKDNKKIKDLISELDRAKNNTAATDVETTKMLEGANKYCAGMEKIISMYTTAAISAVKFGLSQDRKMLGKLVAYNPRAINDSALLMEEADYEADSELESLSDDSEAEVPTDEFPAELEDFEDNDD